MAYIYQISNDINNKIYIGKTEFSIEKRFKEHCQDAFRERLEQRPLYAAMRKYGIEHFSISLIEETDFPEEREIYWIEKLGTFKHGYNATRGGDGRKYLDYELIIHTYYKIKKQNKVAELLNIHPDSVRNVLRSCNEHIYTSIDVRRMEKGKMVDMYNLNKEYIQSFPNLHAAATYMIENNLTNCKHSTIRTHISEVCHGKRKTAAKFIWQFADKPND